MDFVNLVWGIIFTMRKQSPTPVTFAVATGNTGTCFLCCANVKVCSSLTWYMPVADGSTDK
jgi:uncharacterized membrane protein